MLSSVLENWPGVGGEVIDKEMGMVENFHLCLCDDLFKDSV